MFCGRQNVAIRGHTDDRSNFVELLNIKLKAFCRWEPRKKYLSPTIENLLLDVCGDHIRDSLASSNGL